MFTFMTCTACSPSLIIIQTCVVKGCPPAAPVQDLEPSSVPGNPGCLPRLRDVVAAFLFAECVSERHRHMYRHTLIPQAPHNHGSPRYLHRPSTDLMSYARSEDPYLTCDPA